MSVIEELQSAVSAVAAKVGPSVVGVGHKWAAGSGIVISEGVVLTNAHNIRGPVVNVVFADSNPVPAQIAGVDPDADLAVLTLDTGGAGVLPLPDGDPDVSTGQVVFAVSNPAGRGLRVTWGQVSGTGRRFRGPRGRGIGGGIEHTSPLLPGSSGGPIVDAGGRLLGMNTHRLGEGFYVAIPAGAALKRAVDALSRGEVTDRARLGIGVAPPWVARRLRQSVGLPEAEGLLVREVEEGGPAHAAGIVQGDLIVSAGGTALDGVDRLYEVLDGAEPGSAIELVVLRGTQERTVTASLGVRER